MKKITSEQFAIIKQLYCQEKLSSREIGARFGCSKHPILRILQELGVKTRNTRSKGRQPTPDELRKWIVTDCRTYTDIANELGVDISAVAYWRKKYNITSTASTWGQRLRKKGFQEPTKEDLEALYIDQELSLAQIGRLFGVTRQVIKNRMSRFAITLRPDGWQGKRFICADGHIVRSTYEKRVDDWLYEHHLEHEYSPLAPFNNRCHADFRVKDTFIEIWGVTDSETYASRKAYKISRFVAERIPLISIDFWDFDARHNALWERKLNKLLE